MLFGLGILVGVLLFGVGCAEPEPEPIAATHEAELRAFLERGPTQGLWETKRLDERRRAYFAPLRDHPDRILMAPAPAGPDSSFCKTCRHPCSYTRPQIAQFFFEAPPFLFFENYVREGEAETTRLDDGTPAVVATWVPRHAAGEHLTARDVWFDPETGIVLQIEDYSRGGHLIRRVFRVSADTGEWDPSTFDATSDPVCEAPCPSCRGTSAEQLAAVQAEAPYAIVHPTWLPEGFALIRSFYREMPVFVGASNDEDTTVPVRFASLLYSDGMALISIGMAPPDEMDLIQAKFTKMSARRADSGEGVCATTLDNEPPGQTGSRPTGGIVRWRSDTCRTVARRDGSWGLSVTMLGRNEISGDDYVKLIEFLAPYDTASR